MVEQFKVTYWDSVKDEFVFNKKTYFEKWFSGNTISDEIMNLPVAVVSVAGDTRTGKSFLLNYFLRYLKNYDKEDWMGDPDEPLKGFSWRGGVERETIGIDIWPEPLIIKRKDGTKIAVILMDTQAILSSIQIYNVLHNILTNHITFLSELSSNVIKVSEECKTHSLLKMLFLVRDWSLSGESNYGFEVGRSFLERKKSNQSAIESFASQWKIIYDAFHDIDCFLMPSLGDKAEEFDFNGEISKLKPLFVKCLKEFVPALLSPENIHIKSVGKRPFTVSDFFKHLGSQSIYQSALYIKNKTRRQQEPKIADICYRARAIYMEVTRHAYNSDSDMGHDFKRARDEALKFFDEETKLFNPLFTLGAKNNLELFFIEFEIDFVFCRYKPKGWKKLFEPIRSSLKNAMLLAQVESKKL